MSTGSVTMAQPSHLNFKMKTVSGDSKDIQNMSNIAYFHMMPSHRT